MALLIARMLISMARATAYDKSHPVHGRHA
jgi:hypothetical protein